MWKELPDKQLSHFNSPLSGPEQAPALPPAVFLLGEKYLGNFRISEGKSHAQQCENVQTSRD